MNKKNEIKKILNLIVLTKGLNISESKIDSIAEKLNNRWIDVIVDIINKK